MKLRKLLLCLSFGFLVTTTIDVYANETDAETPIIEEQEGIVDSSADEIQYGWDSTHSTYTKEDGTLAIGWTEIDGATYYFDQSGIMQKNQWIEDKYIGPDGIMVTNQWVDDRYVDDSGNWVKNIFVYQDGWKYLYGDGSYAINKFEVIDGSTYYFNNAGYMVTGWQEINGYWYYFNASGAMITNQWQENYYLLDDGKMAVHQWINDRYVNSSGVWVKNQWIYNGQWWFRYGDGSYPQGKFEVLDGSTYYFNNSGYMVTGWKVINGDWYYFNTLGVLLKNQWVGNYYVGSDGKMFTNQWIGNCYVDASGLWQPNKWMNDGKWWFRYGDGSYPKGKFEVLDGSTYYFNNAGYMLTDWQIINGNWYYFNTSGVLLKNQWVGNYYVGSDGKMFTNQWIGNCYVDASGLWQPNKWMNDGKWWFRYGDGSYPKGKFEVLDGSTYYFNNAGYMLTDWQIINGNWYYFNTSGVMLKNRWINNYYVGSDGKMLVNQWIDDFYVDNNGLWDQSKKAYELVNDANGIRCFNNKISDYEKNCWKKITGYYYYFNQNGYALTGTQTIDAKIYHFDLDGKMLTGWYEENGNTYWLDENGQKSSGWHLVNGTWYYWLPDTFTQANSGWQLIENKYYYFSKDGSMKTDWLQINNSDWYYLGNDGACKTGLLNIDSNAYYFYQKNDANGGPEGLMARNRKLNIGNVTVLVDDSGYVYRSGVSNISYLSQKDSRWSNTLIGDYTIGGTGCVPTTAAMIINYYKGTNYTPVDIATKFYDAGYMNTSTYLGSNGDSFLVVKNEFGLSYENNLSYNQLIGSLKAGKLVACAVGPGTFVGWGYTHEILLTGYNDGYVTVYDPLDSSKNGSYLLSSIWRQQSNDKDDKKNGGPFFAF